jgi:hypothetical protein
MLGRTYDKIDEEKKERLQKVRKNCLIYFSDEDFNHQSFRLINNSKIPPLDVNLALADTLLWLYALKNLS